MVCDNLLANCQQYDLSKLPESCFFKDEERPSGTVIAHKELVNKNFRGVRFRKLGRTSTGNIITLLFKEECNALIGIGRDNNLVIHQEVVGHYDLAM